MDHIICPLCQCSEYQVVYSNLPDRMFDHDGTKTTFVRCNQCRLIYQNPRPSIAEMANYYPEEYECYQDVTSVKKVSLLLKESYKYGMLKRLNAVRTWKKQGWLLDIGCASGLFLNFVRSNSGFNVRGEEINLAASQYARDHFKLDVFTGSLEESAYPDSSFDAVTMWDVLEHIHDPLAGLREVFRILKPGGIVVMRVPNGAGWDARLFRQYWAGLEAPRHLFIFTLATLTELVSRAGLAPLAHTTNGGGYTTFLLSLRFFLAERLNQPELAVSDDTWMRFFYSPFARLVTAPIFALPGIFQNGTLLTFTAVKPTQGSIS
jgi:2-polyprenyl-3-methyl-5-hydroxy-6-metoxy-1,4-benzoquinol methylase